MIRIWPNSLPIAAVALGAGCAVPPDVVAVSVQSGETIDTPDVDLSTPDAEPGTPDAAPGTPDAAPGTPDSDVSTPDVGQGTLDGNARDGKSGRPDYRLRDTCGNVVVLRGVNEMANAASDPTGKTWLPEIARTGANAVRLRIGTPGAIIPELDTLLTNCEKANLAAILTIAAPDGGWSDLNGIVQSWLSPDVLPVLQAHSERVLVDMVDAFGDDSISDTEWVNRYTKSIQTLRGDGALGKIPLLVGPPARGTRARSVLESGEIVETADPVHRTVLTITMRPTSAGTYNADEIANVLEAASRLNFTVLVSAFGPKADDCATDFEYGSVLSNANRFGLGWMAWSWGAAHNEACPDEDMTEGGSFDRLRAWGEEAVHGEYGLEQTATPNHISTGEPCH